MTRELTEAETKAFLLDYFVSSDKYELVKEWSERTGIDLYPKVQSMRVAGGYAGWSTYKNPYSKPALIAYQREFGIQKTLVAVEVVAEHAEYINNNIEDWLKMKEQFEENKANLIKLGLVWP